MIDRRGLLAAGVALGGVAVGAGPALARSRPAARAFDPRDLGGTWTNATYTDLQRPKELSRLVLSAAEAEAYEQPLRALNGMPAAKAGEVGQSESEFNDRGAGLLRVRGEIRASLITDPADGQIPYLKAIRARLELDRKPEDRTVFLDNPEDRPAFERCLVTSATTAPLIPGPDTNLYRFVQTREALAIVAEKFHDARIVRLGAPAEPHPLPSWLGASVGRWAGDTLVVETTGFGPGLVRRGLAVSAATRVTETFTRTGRAEILYGFTVEDPSLYTRPWRGEMLFSSAPGELYEYACHEGNYGLPDILLGARRAEGRLK